MSLQFRAIWSAKLKLVTGAIILLAAFMTIRAEGAYGMLLALLILICAAMATRGYSIDGATLRIHRLGWSRRLNLADLVSVRFAPAITAGSARLFGVGGLFGFTGYFRNASLGTYAAYATNGEDTVVLEFRGRNVVVTPDRPNDFVSAVEAAAGRRG